MTSDIGLRIAMAFVASAAHEQRGPRQRCEHGRPMPRWPGAHAGNWGDWRCACAASRAYCQECGAPINENTSECMAYEATKERPR